MDMMRTILVWFADALLFVLVMPAYGQDLFLGNFTTSSVEHSMHPDESSTVFTISVSSVPGMCLDFANGHGQNYLQLWKCNGHENQLFYFDSGKYQIQWGGDRSKCVDAGDLKAGNTLFLWPCNQETQQLWSYDSTAKTVYLKQSESDATFCMDARGEAKTAGTLVEIWNCDAKWNQMWDLQVGITIRPLADNNYCLDLPGGSTDKGTKVQIWQCAGISSQKWFYDSGTFTIRPANAYNMCLDNGGTTKNTYLFIWPCNGQAQQHWGYDFVTMRTLYLASGDSNANVCIDVTGGQIKNGQPIQTWDCNSCWNQQFQVIGPSSDLRKPLPARHQVSSVTTSASRFLGRKQLIGPQVEGGCPPRPGPAPAPAPEQAQVLAHCEVGEQKGWSRFASQDDLNASPAWAAYFKLVYGEIPTTGYPICTYGLTLLYKPLVAQAGLGNDWTYNEDCPKADGKPYAKMSGFPATDWGWIYNSKLGHPNGYALPGGRWVEVMHTAFAMDGSATWFYYTPGSGVFMWLGATKVYDDHPDAVHDLLGADTKCRDKGVQLGKNECAENFEDMYKAAMYRKYETLQFTKHADMQCSTRATYQGNMAIEIVDLAGPGGQSCSTVFENGATEGWTRFRAGWQAKYKCYCDNTHSAINCKGFAMTR